MPVSKKCKELFCLLYSAILFISGILLIILSIYLGCKLASHFKFVVTLNIAPFILIFLFGFLHILLTWLGVKGPTKEHLFHIILFLVFTVILLISEMAVGIWSVVLRGQVYDNSMQLMKNSFHGLVSSKFDIDSKDWDTLQSELNCCGINNISDYISFLPSQIPTSCHNKTAADAIIFYQGGCKDPLTAYIRKAMLNIALVGFCSGLFQIIGIVLFYYFYKAVKQDIALRAEIRRASRVQEGNPLNRQSSQLDKRASLTTTR